jgi:hypothetical protein
MIEYDIAESLDNFIARCASTGSKALSDWVSATTQTHDLFQRTYTNSDICMTPTLNLLDQRPYRTGQTR